MAHTVLDNNNGFVVNPTVGARYAVNHYFAINIGIGYRLTGIFYRGVPNENTYFGLAHALTIRTGIDF